jgi:hypothetical protein
MRLPVGERGLGEHAGLHGHLVLDDDFLAADRLRDAASVWHIRATMVICMLAFLLLLLSLRLCGRCLDESQPHRHY